MEFVGGPYDGTMQELKADYPVDTAPGIILHEPRVLLPDGRHRIGPVRGHYRFDGLLDEELGIVRMGWRQGPPDGLEFLDRASSE